MVGERKTEAEAVPRRLIDLLALLRRRFQGRLLVRHETEAGRRIPGLLAPRLVVCLDLPILLLSDRSVGGGNTIVGRSLKHGEVAGLFGDDGCHLHP